MKRALVFAILLTAGQVEFFTPLAQAQGVAALSCTPAVIIGGSGQSSTCTVSLGAPAPAAGTVVALSSSLPELAASVPSVTVPSGQSNANFTVGTNARYRRYSVLAFSADISASANGTTRSARIDVTAQARPADFTNPNTSADASPWQGLICGRRSIINGGGNPEILYNCSLPSDGSFGVCTFQQECSIGCQVGAASGFTSRDFCATTGPNPVAIATNRVIGGERIAASIQTDSPVGTSLTQGLPGAISNQGLPGAINGINVNASVFPHNGGITIPSGTSSVGFAVATSIVPAVTFIDVVATWTGGSNGRGGHAWLALAPPTPAPALPIPTLGDFKITGANPVTGGQSSTGQLDVSGISSGGGPTVTFTSSHPNIVSAPANFTFPANTVLGQQVTIATQAPAAETAVTITATDGRQTFSTVLTVRPPAAAAVLAGISVSPSSVVGGNTATGTVTLSAAQSGSTVIALSTPAPSTVASMPSSVTVPAGQTSASFTISTAPRTEADGTFFMNIFVNLSGSPGQSALLLITAGPAPSATLSALSLSPTSVTGGSSSTGTVTLSSAAPSGGAVVSLSSNSASVNVPSSVSVAAGSTSATFNATTSAVSSATTATISAVLAGVTRSSALTVNPPSTTVRLSVSATGRSGERITSSPTGINVAVGSTASANFASGTSITLTVSNGRNAIWSGACSSGGNKARSCTFTINANASVTGNVQ
jgi:hypothetical protein